MKVTGQKLNITAGQVEAGKADKVGNNNKSELKSSAAALEGANLNASSKVNVSDRAQMMQKAKDIASDQSIDEAKVARLQKMIDAGEYKVDAKSVADRLVDEHLMIPE